MSNILKKTLTNKGPQLSGALIAHLMKMENLSHSAARKRLSRVQLPIRRLKGIIYKNNQRLYYLESQYGKQKYFEGLIESFNKGAPAYANSILALKNKGGAVSSSGFLVSCGSPVAKLKGHLLAQTILERLIQNKVLSETVDSKLGKVIEYNLTPASNSHAWGIALAETVALGLVSDWARKLSLTAFSQQNIRQLHGKPPEFGGFAWDYTAPCYLDAIARYKNKIKVPGFFLCDVWLGRNLSASDLRPFISKIKTIRNRKGLRPFIACFVSDSLTQDAIKLLRTNGILVGLLSNIFNPEVSRFLSDLIQTLENAAAVAVKNPGQVKSLFERLSKIEGATLNVRGALFELIVGHYFSDKGDSIDIRKKILDQKTGRRAEIDVFARHGHAISTFVECRGKSSSGLVSPNEIQHWLTNKIPLTRKIFISSDPQREQVFEFWTSGLFHPEAEKQLRKAQRDVRKYKINYFDLKGVLKLLRGAKLQNLVEVLEEHYSSP